MKEASYKDTAKYIIKATKSSNTKQSDYEYIYSQINLIKENDQVYRVTTKLFTKVFEKADKTKSDDFIMKLLQAKEEKYCNDKEKIFRMTALVCFLAKSNYASGEHAINEYINYGIFDAALPKEFCAIYDQTYSYGKDNKEGAKYIVTAFIAPLMLERAKAKELSHNNHNMIRYLELKDAIINKTEEICSKIDRYDHDGNYYDILTNIATQEEAKRISDLDLNHVEKPKSWKFSISSPKVKASNYQGL